jgi:hypothetical protein
VATDLPVATRPLTVLLIRRSLVRAQVEEPSKNIQNFLEKFYLGVIWQFHTKGRTSIQRCCEGDFSLM